MPLWNVTFMQNIPNLEAQQVIDHDLSDLLSDYCHISIFRHK